MQGENAGLMQTFQVKFKISPDPRSSEGLILSFEDVGELNHGANHLTVSFKSRFDLDSAFLAAGIYLRDNSQPDPERSATPTATQNYEVTDETLRVIGFAIPK
jgi:hypothetical protein